VKPRLNVSGRLGGGIIDRVRGGEKERLMAQGCGRWSGFQNWAGEGPGISIRPIRRKRSTGGTQLNW